MQYKQISGAVLSMSPVEESAYENAAFSGENAKKGKKKVLELLSHYFLLYFSILINNVNKFHLYIHINRLFKK